MATILGINLNPFKGLLDENENNPHSRVLRTTWFTKMADTFKVFFGNFSLFNVLPLLARAEELKQDRNLPQITADLPKNPTLKDKINVMSKVIAYLLPNKKLGLADYLFSPAILMIIPGLIVGLGLVIALFIPTLIGLLILGTREKSLKNGNKAAAIAAQVFGLLFMAPAALTAIALIISAVALYLAFLLVKATISAVFTLIAMPIVSIVNALSYIKSLPLFNNFKKLEITYNNAPIDIKEKSVLLSALNRERFTCEINDRSDELLIVDSSPSKKGRSIPSLTISAKAATDNPVAFKSLCELNMFRVHNNPKFAGWCGRNGISVETRKREPLREPLMRV